METKEIIRLYLADMASKDENFAERFADENKNLDECMDYITSEARKLATNNCAFVSDDLVFGWAAHYYQEKDLKVEKGARNLAKSVAATTPVSKAKANNITRTHTREEKPTMKVTKEATKVDKKAPKKGYVELSLFGDL